MRIHLDRPITFLSNPVIPDTRTISTDPSHARSFQLTDDRQSICATAALHPKIDFARPVAGEGERVGPPSRADLGVGFGCQDE